ncbi:MAG: hypothetical protein INR69_15430 [Mucilaginibacter polytrichastri]|nr:hypothetical protein [Mucilaginibacter polytrichastri]
MEANSLSPEEQQERFDLITHKLKFVQQKPLVAVLRALSPPEFNAGLLEAAILHAGGALFSEVKTADTLPEILLVAVPELSVGAAMAQLPDALAQTELASFPAVTDKKIYILDTDRMNSASELTRTEAIAEIIQPKQFIFGYEGDFWLRFG